MVPKNPLEIFAYICHVIFAIIIATSYESAIKLFINPKESFLMNSTFVIYGLEFLLAYSAIISGWIGYARSMMKWPHTNTKYGTLRFSLDIAILFCYFGLLISADPENEFKNNFLKWIFVLFVLFLVSDFIKIKEYYKTRGKIVKQSLIRSIMKTTIFVIIIGVILHITTLQGSKLIEDTAIYTIILLVVTSIMILYRYWKWSIPAHPYKPPTNS